MDNFWSKLLILGIVAAIGLFFIGNVYNPQREAQEAMALSTQQSVEAVKADIGDAAPSIVKGDSVVSAINLQCKEGNTVPVKVNKGAQQYTFTTSATATAADGTTSAVSTVIDNAKNYARVVAKTDGVTTAITYTEQ